MLLKEMGGTKASVETALRLNQNRFVENVVLLASVEKRFRLKNRCVVSARRSAEQGVQFKQKLR